MGDHGTLRPLHSRATLGVGAVAVALAAVLLATANRYGFHRDELYFMEAGRHLDWGYIDQPALTPFLGRAAQEIFGSSPRGLRVPSVLAGVAVVLLTASLARLFGGTRRAQVLAAVCSAIAAFLLAVSHILSTSTFDVLAWIALLWLVVRILQGADHRLWLAVGAVAGVGLLNKHLILFLVGALLIGILVGGRADVLRSKWVVAGAGIALLIWSPNLIWQATHGWPQLDMARAIAEDEGTENRATLLPLQLVLLGPLMLPVWVAGLWWLGRSPATKPLRPLAWAYPILLVTVFLGAGKGYYVAPILFVYLAAGCVLVDAWMRTRLRAVLFTGTVAISGVIAALIALPILPASDVGNSPAAAFNDDALETIGWPTFVDQVAKVVGTLTPDERQRVIIFTANYGEAGAIDRYGPALGLPRAYSGHNSYSDWGIPPDSAGPVVIVGADQAFVDEHWTGCEQAATIDNAVDVDNEEQGASIWRCAAPAQPWDAVWDDLTHFN